MHGRIVGLDGDRRMNGIELDTRRLSPDQLFFALVGESSDGHRYLEDAARRGASAAVVHRDDLPQVEGLTLVRVDDTYRALHDLTHHVRRQVPERLVAITGSTGKTSTKELLALLLARRFRVAKSEGNFNNLYGFPLSLLNIPDDTEWMVAEMGMSESGELGKVSRLGRPDVAVYTNVRPVHLEFFGSLEAIARAKAELLEGLAPDGLVVVNASDPHVAGIGRVHQEGGGRVVWYATEQDADAPGLAMRPRGIEAVGGQELGYRFTLEHRPGGEGGWQGVTIRLPLHGRYNVDNFLAAAATALALGIPPEELAAGALDAAAASHRGVVRRLGSGVTVIDDCYNSNPEALSRALESAAELPASRRWAVLGDMLELGPDEKMFHAEAGREAAERGFAPVAAVGGLAVALADGAARAGVSSHAFAEASEAARWAASEVRPGDLVLVKGSRGVGLEVVIEALEDACGSEETT